MTSHVTNNRQPIEDCGRVGVWLFRAAVTIARALDRVTVVEPWSGLPGGGASCPGLLRFGPRLNGLHAANCDAYREMLTSRGRGAAHVGAR